METEKLLDLGHFSDIVEETYPEETEEAETTEEEVTPEVEEETTPADETKESIASFDIALDNALIDDLEAKATPVAEELLRKYGFKTIEELEEQGEGGQQIAEIIRIAEEKTNSLKKAVAELKSLRENPTVKSAIVTQEITKVFNENRDAWISEFAEDAPELFERIKKVPKKLAAELAPQIDALVGEYALKKRSAGKQIMNPYLALQTKIEKLVSGATTTTEPKKEEPKKESKKIDTNQQKKLASLKTSAAPIPPAKTDPRLSGLPKSRVEGMLSMSHLADSIKVDE
jgi:hypothetical protein